MHDDQPFGIHVGKRPEDDLVEHAEEGGRRANPVREDQHGEDRERGRSPQGTPRLAHIMRDGFEHRGSWVICHSVNRLWSRHVSPKPGCPIRVTAGGGRKLRPLRCVLRQRTSLPDVSQA